MGKSIGIDFTFSNNGTQRFTESIFGIKIQNETNKSLNTETSKVFKEFTLKESQSGGVKYKTTVQVGFERSGSTSVNSNEK